MKTKKILALALAAVLLVAVGVGGTLAWMTAKTDEVTNTFSASNIGLTLQEHPLKEDGKTIDKSADTVDSEDGYTMIPGDTLQKDPFATVTTGSVSSYVFIEVCEANNTLPSNSAKKYINWEVDTTKWTQVDNAGPKGGVVYMYNTVVNAGSSTESILKGEQVTVDTAITTSDMTAANTQKPTLTFYAYSVQSENQPDTTAAALWVLAEPAAN